MRFLLITLAIAAALVGQVAGAASTVVVTRESFFYDPLSTSRVTRVRVGDTVTWENRGERSHDVTFDGQPWRSGLIRAGGSWSRTFATFGTFTYACTLHQSEDMTGTVIVSRAPAAYSVLFPIAPR